MISVQEELSVKMVSFPEQLEIDVDALSCQTVVGTSVRLGDVDYGPGFRLQDLITMMILTFMMTTTMTTMTEK